MVRPRMDLLRARALAVALEAADKAARAADEAARLLAEPPVPSLDIYLTSRECVMSMDPGWRESLLKVLRYDEPIFDRWGLHNLLKEHAPDWHPCTPEQIASGIEHTGNMVWPLYDAFAEEWRALGPLVVEPEVRALALPRRRRTRVQS